jgi:hypothetical protein
VVPCALADHMVTTCSTRVDQAVQGAGRRTRLVECNGGSERVPVVDGYTWSRLPGTDIGSTMPSVIVHWRCATDRRIIPESAARSTRSISACPTGGSSPGRRLLRLAYTTYVEALGADVGGRRGKSQERQVRAPAVPVRFHRPGLLRPAGRVPRLRDRACESSYEIANEVNELGRFPSS